MKEGSQKEKWGKFPLLHIQFKPQESLQAAWTVDFFPNVMKCCFQVIFISMQKLKGTFF